MRVRRISFSRVAVPGLSFHTGGSGFPLALAEWLRCSGPLSPWVNDLLPFLCVWPALVHTLYLQCLLTVWEIFVLCCLKLYNHLWFLSELKDKLTYLFHMFQVHSVDFTMFWSPLQYVISFDLHLNAIGQGTGGCTGPPTPPCFIWDNFHRQRHCYKNESIYN